MTITVEFVAHFRLATGVQKVSMDLDNISIKDLIDQLGLKYGSKFLDEILENGGIMEDILFLKNGTLINDVEEKIRDGDTLSLIPPAFGG
ncbi:MAG TPA: MoaD family protein [Candidatus Methanofastidiosa archaeon]|nr:MoaD family protein [Candidatus Methanofastidiosa archaeon]HPR41096.1 MoaD family protein [Candidatus Methanofastidiosa archaeon]